MSTGIYWIVFIGVIVAFGAIGFSAAKQATHVSSYFHKSSLWKNIISLTATDITIGTGIIYLISGAHTNGGLILLVPLATACGYYLQAWFLEKYVRHSLRNGRNFLANLSDEIAIQTGRASPFAKTVSFCLVLVFVLLLAFEIFASSKAIAPLLFGGPSAVGESVISMVVFTTTVFYTILGGVNALFKVDRIQVPLILLFLPVFFAFAVPDWSEFATVSNRLAASFKFDADTIVSVTLAVIAAITTQFYSILNWGAVSNIHPNGQRKLLCGVGTLSGLILCIFVLIGLLHPSGGTDPWAEVFSSMAASASSQTNGGVIFGVILTLGFSSILLTTTDAVVINSIMFWYDNVLNKNSGSAESSPKELGAIRKIGLVAFSGSFVVLSLLNYLQPDPFYLLLSMASGITAFAPFIFLAGILSATEGRLRVISPGVVRFFLLVFLITGAASVWLLLTKSHLVAYVGGSAFVLSCLGCTVIWAKSLRLPKPA